MTACPLTGFPGGGSSGYAALRQRHEMLRVRVDALEAIVRELVTARAARRKKRARKPRRKR